MCDVLPVFGVPGWQWPPRGGCARASPPSIVPTEAQQGLFSPPWVLAGVSSPWAALGQGWWPGSSLGAVAMGREMLHGGAWPNPAQSSGISSSHKPQSGTSDKRHQGPNPATSAQHHPLPHPKTSSVGPLPPLWSSQHCHLLQTPPVPTSTGRRELLWDFWDFPEFVVTKRERKGLGGSAGMKSALATRGIIWQVTSTARFAGLIKASELLKGAHSLIGSRQQLAQPAQSN